MSVIDSKDVKFVEDDMMGPGMMDEGDLTYKNNGGGMTSEVMSAADSDDKELEALGYVPSFKREFSNLATVCYVPFFCVTLNGWKLIDVIFLCVI